MHPPSLEFRFMPPWPVYAAVGRTETGMESIERAKTIMDSTMPPSQPADRPRAAAIGLHLGTHRDSTTHQSGRLPARKKRPQLPPHHSGPSFPNILRNNKGFQPFPFPGAMYPGVKFDAKGAVTTIQDPSAPGAAIDVATTSNPERGQNMPAINLLRDGPPQFRPARHSRVYDLGQASQGAAIHQVFNPICKNVQASAVEATLTFERTAPSLRRTCPSQVVQDTYSWIWNDEMKDALRGKMPAKEVQFYLDQFPSDKPDSVQHLKYSPCGRRPSTQCRLMSRSRPMKPSCR